MVALVLMVGLVLKSGAVAAATLCQMNALKSPAQPYPSPLACSLLFYAFYDSDLQTAKKLQEIKTELKISATMATEGGLLL
jgi:hypothetical protein